MADKEKQPEMVDEAVQVAEVLKSVQIIPPKKKLVKKMMYESFARFVSSLFCHCDSASTAHPSPPPPPPAGRSEKRSATVVPHHQKRP